MPEPFFRDWPTILRRGIYESGLPLLGGGTWVTWSWYQALPFFEALSGFGIGYLFVLAVQGQVLRIAKNVRDETDADEFRNSFRSIHEALDELNRQRGEAPARPRERAPFYGVADFSEADRAMDAGLYRAAAAMAALIFEQYIRDVAVKFGVDARLPLTRLVQLVTAVLGDGHSDEEFNTLIRIRNSLVHSRFQDIIMNKSLAEQFIDGFKRGVERLQATIEFHFEVG